jgi:hypothetical protein
VWAASLLEYTFPGEGYAQDVQTYGEVIADDIHNPTGYFDIDDAHESYYIIGIACAMHALQISGVDLSLVPALKHRLIEQQLADGSWYLNAGYPDSDPQSTAYALQKLSFLGLWERHVRWAVKRGARWLVSRQLPSGGWELVPGYENTEVDAEILFALMNVSPTPQSGKKCNQSQEHKHESARRFLEIRTPVASPLTF